MKRKFKIVSKRHLKKLGKFWKRKAAMGNETKPSMYIKHTVHNSSVIYCLGKKLWLDHHAPTFSHYNAVKIEF